MSSKKKNLLQSILTPKAGSGCGCGRPKLSDVYEPAPKPKPKPKTSISKKIRTLNTVPLQPHVIRV
ncbi:hypothetical protein NC651_011670 [Populus alba x Populus x berolinensis]|nr:hypothetical protein NC651_011670 [Populus alba x Populus x berolinensis]